MNQPLLYPRAAFQKRWLTTRRLGAALLAATCLLALAHAAAAAPRRAQSQSCGDSDSLSVMVQTATATNSLGDFTVIDNPLANNCPQAGVVVTATFTPGGVYDPHPLGVWYTGTRWAIFHEDQTAIPLFATYNVLVDGYATYGNGPMRVMTATAFNVVAGSLLATGDTDPNFPPMVTSTYNPEGVGGVYDKHLLGLLWGPNPGQWYIYHQDATPIPNAASYDLFESYSFQLRMVQTATTSNSAGDYTIVNAPGSYNSPQRLLFVIPLSGSIGYDNHALGVWYTFFFGRWTIFHEDGTPIPVGATYEVFSL